MDVATFLASELTDHGRRRHLAAVLDAVRDRKCSRKLFAAERLAHGWFEPGKQVKGDQLVPNDGVA